MQTKEESKVTIEGAGIFYMVSSAALAYLSWDKRQDKLKIKEIEKELSEVKGKVERHDERTKAMQVDLSEIKTDIKDVKTLLIKRGS